MLKIIYNLIYIYRLWVKGRFVGYKGSKNMQYEKQALIQMEGVRSKPETDFYFGKRVCYIYKAHTIRKNSKFRTIWGTISKAHGGNGLVRARFRKNLPPAAMGGPIRVMLYPQRT